MGDIKKEVVGKCLYGVARFITNKEGFVIKLLLLQIGIFTFIRCGESIKQDQNILPIFYITDIHDGYPHIFKADSLLFYENKAHALSTFQQMDLKPLSLKHRSYIQAKILLITDEKEQTTGLYKTLKQMPTKDLHAETVLDVCRYELILGIEPIWLNDVKSILSTHKNHFISGKAAYLISMYFDEINHNLDSAFYYVMKSKEAFEKTKVITTSYQDCLEKITTYCTYQRKNLLAIRYANRMFDFTHYCPAADRIDMARAYANRAFVLFREGDVLGSKEDVALGVSCIFPNQDASWYQALLRTTLVLSMLEQNEASWLATTKILDDHIEAVCIDFIDMDRWRGHYYTQRGNYLKALDYLHRSLQEETRTGRKNMAKYSTLCSLISLCYEGLGNYAKALDYMAKNAWYDAHFDDKKMKDHILHGQSYSFYDALRCVQIYLAEYKKNYAPATLQQAITYLDLLDSVMYQQYQVAEENAILQFYLESGQACFQAGLDVYYETWKKSRKYDDLTKFIHYSEKNKNSLLFRDLQMAQKTSKVSEALTQEELYLRSLIKGEKRKGLRNNANFDHYMDQYVILEQNIQQSHKHFITQGLKKQTVDIHLLQNQMPHDSVCILVVDETVTFWYYTLILKNKVIVERMPKNQKEIQNIDSMIVWMQTVTRRDVHEQSKYRNRLFPKAIQDHLVGQIYFIPDGQFHRFPIQTLWPQGNYHVRILPSLHLFNHFVTQNNKIKGAGFFAFSDLETIKSPSRTRLVELPGSYNEVMAISQQHPSAQIFTGKKATKKNFLDLYQDTNITYLHLALHGLASSIEKDDVKLYFRDEAGDLDSLYGYELLGVRSRCQKVVLSACQSGLGALVNGEGSYSLPRYFMINGATDVVFNYWDVED